MAALAVTLGAISGSLASDVPEAAAATCTNFGNNHLGYVHSTPQGVIGAGVDLTVGFGSLCTSDPNQGTNFSTAWAMFQEIYAPYGYAQSGHIRRWGYDTRNFSEFNPDFNADNYGFTRTYGSLVGLGTSQFYWVYFSSSCGCLDLNVGYTNIDSTPFNPYSVWSNVGGSWSSETIWDTNGVPGTSSSPETFGGMRVQPFSSSSYSYNSAAASLYDTAPSTDHISGIYYASFTTHHT